MAEITVSTKIHAPPSQVWDIVKDIDDHVNWMKDAERIDFISDNEVVLEPSLIALQK